MRKILFVFLLTLGCTTETITSSPPNDGRIPASDGVNDRRMIEIVETFKGESDDQAKIKAQCLDGKLKGTKAARKKASKQARKKCKADPEALGCNFLVEEATYFTYNAEGNLGLGTKSPYSCDIKAVFTYPLKPKP